MEQYIALADSLFAYPFTSNDLLPKMRQGIRTCEFAIMVQEGR